MVQHAAHVVIVFNNVDWGLTRQHVSLMSTWQHAHADSKAAFACSRHCRTASRGAFVTAGPAVRVRAAHGACVATNRSGCEGQGLPERHVAPAVFVSAGLQAVTQSLACMLRCCATHLIDRTLPPACTLPLCTCVTARWRLHAAAGPQERSSCRLTGTGLYAASTRDKAIVGGSGPYAGKIWKDVFRQRPQLL